MPLLVSRTDSRAIRVGFDGIAAADFSVPSLTSVSPDNREIARTAMSLLLNRIDAPDSLREG
ncbi:substrate-binding domain-containing protein [Streptomyces sp. NBC_00986]|uniref:substrate-binding domain-containing protein n=1 Tax=Streptomyces sp. NBC_00986 TaxID=2903702 RepID=UPI00386C6514|nr:substrate-binding domain-containing protein [Streptomyces sp. NBC_00986]